MSTKHVLAGRIGGYTKWANCEDPTAATAPGRKAFLDRFEQEVDPERKLTSAERARRATAARKAHFTRLALKSVQARNARSKAKNLTAEVELAEHELSEMDDVAQSGAA